MNDTLADVEPLGRLLFAGLWCIADREGRLEDRPRRIKAEVLPYDDCDVDQLLDQLVRHEFIQRYQVGGEQYIQIINFSKHQNPHKNEADSVIPGPEDATYTQAPDKHSTSTVQVPDMHNTNPADSLNMIPDSLNMIPSSAQAHQESGQADQLLDEQRKRATKRSSLAERFDQFWAAYPKKRSKGQAEKAWAKIKPNEQLLGQMLDAIERAKTSVDWTRDSGKYMPYPATWLNAKGWEDEYEQPSTGNYGKGAQGASGVYDDIDLYRLPPTGEG